MPKEEWGVKRTCPSCSVRFYDLQRDPMTCPSCGHSFTLASLRAGSGRSAVTAGRSASKQEAAPVKEETPDEGGGSELEEEVLEEDSDDKVSLDDIADVDPGDDNS